MKYLLISLFCCLATVPSFSEEAPRELILSTPDQMAALCSESSDLVGGVVHPLSGLPLVGCTDLVVKGAQELLLNRVYIPLQMPCQFPQHTKANGEWRRKYLAEHLTNYYKGWQYLPQMHLEVDFRRKRSHAYVSDANGITMAFSLSGRNHSNISLMSSHCGISNTCGDIPSGRYDPRNTRVTYEANEKKFTVYAMDGTIRIYRLNENGCRPPNWDWYFYVLEKEILPNGKVIKYHFNGGLRPKYIESLDPQERYVYASIRLSLATGGGRHFLLLFRHHGRLLF